MKMSMKIIKKVDICRKYVSHKKTVRTAAASHRPTVEKDICTQKYYLRVPMFAKMAGIS